MKSAKLISILLLFVFLLPACNLATATDSSSTDTAHTTSQPTFVYITPRTDPTNTPNLSLPTVSFSSAVPHVGQTPTYTTTNILPSITPALTRTLVPLPFQILEGLRVAYIIDGNLYVQDSGKQAVQLTHSGQDDGPLFSDDGQKIVFYRGEGNNQLWTIDVNGTGEKALFTTVQLTTFGQKYDERTEIRSLVFISGTHLILFNTHFYRKTRNEPPKLNNDLFLVDTDTAEIRQLSALDQGGNFLVSPNGKQIALQMPDHIDVIDLQGQIVHQNLVTYPANNAHARIPMFWMPDSKELIVLPSDIDPLIGGIPVLRQVWRYSLESGVGLEIRLDPPPMKDAYSISPDGNWIVYSYEPSEIDPNAKVGVYLGNLRDGTSRLIFTPPLNEATGTREPVSLFNYAWNIDSVYFGCYYENVYIGNINGEIISLGREEIPTLIDGNRYLLNGGSVLVNVGKQERFRVVEIPLGTNQPSTFIFLRH